MKCIKILLSIVILSKSVSIHARQGQDTLLVFFWNLENFYDYIDQGTSDSDKEFSSYGKRHWTKKRFLSKCDVVAKTILWIEDSHGRMPDVLGFAEVENRSVLTSILNYTLLRKYDYRIVHFDSNDRRGIDVALLYRKSSFDFVSYSLKKPVHEGKGLATRDILHVCLKDQNQKNMDFIVNHHPSKFGGSEESGSRRQSAMIALRELCDSIKSDRLVVMGDFNDTPNAISFDVVGDILVNKALNAFNRREGTIRYEGKWDLIDMFLVSPELDAFTDMEICKIPFLMRWENKHPGYRPFRTYLGPRYIGGASDHCPIVLKVF